MWKYLNIKILLLMSLLIFSSHATADSTVSNNGLTLVDISANVKAIVGPLSNRTPENLGNNATFGVVITKEGVVLVDSGGSYKGAKAIHDLIKTITDKPIKYVINSGGQDHRWFGNDYFQKLGAKVISSNAAKKDHETRVNDQWSMLETFIGKEAIKDTVNATADITFDEDYTLKLGETELEIHHRGQAHTPGDAFIWLAKEKVMFTGDIVYLDRMLGVGPQSNSKSWMEVFEAMETYKPDVIIPGHGQPATLSKARESTYEYLKYIREEAAKIIENDGDMSEVSKVDQSQYKYLFNHESLSGRNIQKVFSEMEFE